MKKYLPLLLFIGLAWGQTTIAVFDFENNGLKKYEVRQLSTRLESEVVKIGGFRVVERTKIDEILKEQKFQMSGCVDECLIEIGKMMGAKQIILGSVGELAGLYTITVKLVDAETGELIRTSNYDAENGLKELLKIGLKKVAFQLIQNKSSKNDISKNYRNEKDNGESLVEFARKAKKISDISSNKADSLANEAIVSMGKFEQFKILNKGNELEINIEREKVITIAKKAKKAAEKAAEDSEAFTAAGFKAAEFYGQDNFIQSKIDEDNRILAEKEYVKDKELESAAIAAGELAKKRMAEQLGLNYSSGKGKYVPIKEWWSINKKKPVIEVIKVDHAPVALKPIVPIYPENAQKLERSGIVIIAAFIDKKGKVLATKVLEGEEPLLYDAAMTAIRKTKFKPAKKGWKKVGTWVTLPIEFKLN
jgi:TonB family protein